MKGALRLLVVAVLFVLSCSSGPKEVFIHTVPSTGEVTAGDSIMLKAVTLPSGIKGLKYQWHVEATCPVKIKGSGKSVVLKPDLYCFSQKAKVTVTVTSEGKKVSKTKEISIIESPQLPPRLSLNPDMKGWLVINDYNTEERTKKNNLGGAVSTWNFKGGVCKISIQDKALKLSYEFAGSESQCGTAEYFKGELGKPVPFDITKYKKISIKLKSMDKRIHKVKILVIEYDPMHTANQGIVAQSDTLRAFPGRWWRYEITIRPMVGELFDLKRVKSIGLKVIGGEGDKGTILIDDLALVPGGQQ